jgi:hypothetical protein
MAQEWISVEERLPTKGCGYLVYRETPYSDFIEIAYFKLKKKRAGWYKYDSDWGFYTIGDVTHWMPLPEAPKTKGEKL